MSPSSDNGGTYSVHCSGAIAKKLKQIQHQANVEGRGEALLLAYRQILQRLKNDPTNFGEPLYRLPGLRLQIRHGAVRPLFIDFAVSEDRPLVFLKGVQLLPADKP